METSFLSHIHETEYMRKGMFFLRFKKALGILRTKIRLLLMIGVLLAAAAGMSVCRRVSAQSLYSGGSI